MRRLAPSLAAAVLGLVAVMPPASAQSPEELLGPLLETLGGDDLTYGTGFESAPAPGRGTIPDPAGDFQLPSGEEPGHTPGHVDITRAWMTRLDASSLALFDDPSATTVFPQRGLSELDPGTPLLALGPEVASPSPLSGTDAFAFVFELADAPPHPVPGRCEYVAWLDDGGEGSFVNAPGFPLDPAIGANRAFGLRLLPPAVGASATLALQLDEEGRFALTPETDVRALVSGNEVAIIVPESQVRGMEAVNFYAFCSEESAEEDPGATGADETGLTEATFADAGVSVIEEVPVTTTTTTTLATTTSTTPPATLPPAAAPPVASTAGWWALILSGLALAAGGSWLYSGPAPVRLPALVRPKGRLTAAEALAACKEARIDLEERTRERSDLCAAWPPACTESGQAPVDDGRGVMVPADELHRRRTALGEIWTDYRLGRLPREEMEDIWQEKSGPALDATFSEVDARFEKVLEEIDSDLVRARRAVERACRAAQRLGDAATASAEPSPRDDPGPRLLDPRPEGPDDFGPWLPMAPEEPEGPVRLEPAGASSTIEAVVGYSIVLTAMEGGRRGAAGGRQLAIDMTDLVTSTGAGPALRQARSEALGLAGLVDGYNPDLVPDQGVPGEEHMSDVVASVLEDTVTIGGRAVGLANEFASRHGRVAIRRTLQVQAFTSSPYAIWRRDAGVWQEGGTVDVLEVGAPRHVRGRDRVFDVSSEVAQTGFWRLLSRMAQTGARVVGDDVRRLWVWRREA